MAYINPKNVVVDFLRSRMTDPRSRAETSQTQLFDGGSITFQLVPTSGTVSCIQEVKVDETTQTKYKDYYINEQNQKVIFYDNTSSGTDNVSIKFKYGTKNWIYPDKPKESLSNTSFPRINVLVVSGVGERLGQYNSDIESQIHFQVDVWTKEDQVFTIDSNNYSNDKLAEYLAYQIMNVFTDYEDDLHPNLYDYTPLGIPRDMPFDKEHQCFHTLVEVELKGINISQ